MTWKTYGLLKREILDETESDESCSEGDESEEDGDEEEDKEEQAKKDQVIIEWEDAKKCRRQKKRCKAWWTWNIWKRTTKGQLNEIFRIWNYRKNSDASRKTKKGDI